MSIVEATVSNMWEIAAKRERGTRSRFQFSKPGRLSHSSCPASQNFWQFIWNQIIRSQPLVLLVVERSLCSYK